MTSTITAPVALLLVLCASTACRSVRDAVSGGADGVSVGSAGATYYTKFALHQEKDRYRTTNYRRGFLVPVNTEVTLRAATEKEITVDVKETGRSLVIENVPQHTQETIQEAFAATFSEQPVELSRFTAEEQEAIRDGRAEVGMSKDAVLVALGPPPAIGTPSHESSVWKYWSSRFTTFLVHFDGEHATSIGQR